MAFRVLSAIVAIVLMVAFLAPVAVKLKEISLAVVIALGLGLMLWDVWETLRQKEE